MKRNIVYFGKKLIFQLCMFEKMLVYDDLHNKSILQEYSNYEDLTSNNNRQVSVQQFKEFLIKEQNESELNASDIIRNFVRADDMAREVEEPYLNVDEVRKFICYFLTLFNYV